MSVHSRLKVIYITGRRKTFYMQKISESGCARKETVDTGILVTSTNQDSNFLGGSFSNTYYVRALIQFRREGQPQTIFPQEQTYPFSYQ